MDKEGGSQERIDEYFDEQIQPQFHYQPVVGHGQNLHWNSEYPQQPYQHWNHQYPPYNYFPPTPQQQYYEHNQHFYPHQGHHFYPQQYNPQYGGNVYPSETRNDSETGRKIERGKGKGQRGRGRGKGGSHKNTEGVKEYKEYKQKKKAYSSQSHSDESEEEQLEPLEKIMEQLTVKQKRQRKHKVFQEFEDTISYFLTKYTRCIYGRQKIIKYLMKRYENAQDLIPLCEILAELQKQSAHYFQTPYLNFKRILKQTIKQGLQVEAIKQRLDKILSIKAKKESKDEQFKAKYSNTPMIEFLNDDRLQQIDIRKTVFLVDGDNIMTKHKIFRKFYSSGKNQEKVEGQIRLQWLMSETMAGQLFFDYQYEDNLYHHMKQTILLPEEKENLQKISVFYADKHQKMTATADEKLLQRMTEISEKKIYPHHDIVLVTADRELSYHCNEIMKIRKTSGMFFFKYCKFLLRELNRPKPEKKGIIKRIFTY